MAEQHRFFKFSVQNQNLRSILNQYQKLGLFTDCSLIASCGRAINVHRVVLSSCSQFLATIFLRRVADTNPILVFANIQFEDLNRIVEFMYLGEITIEEKHMDGFLLAADGLKVEGIPVGDPVDVLPTENEQNLDAVQSEIVIEEPSQNAENEAYLDDHSNASTKSQSNKEKIPKESTRSKKRKRPVAKKRKSFVRKEIETSSPGKSSSPCKFCGRQVGSRKNIFRHMRECLSNPNRSSFDCSQCSKSFYRKYLLTAHEKTHEND